MVTPVVTSSRRAVHPTRCGKNTEAPQAITSRKRQAPCHLGACWREDDRPVSSHSRQVYTRHRLAKPATFTRRLLGQRAGPENGSGRRNFVTKRQAFTLSWRNTTISTMQLQSEAVS